MANITFNGTDLSQYGATSIGGLHTPEVGGVHDLVGTKVKEVPIPGRDVVDEASLRREMRTLAFKVATAGTSHTNLISNLNALKAACSPALGWCTLAITDKPNKRTIARCEGFGIKISEIPYVRTGVEFSLAFKAYPYWEDDTETTVAVSGTSGTVSNAGDLETPPTFNVTCNATFGSGITIDIGGDTFTYEGSLANGDTLSADMSDYTVTKNGSNAIGGVANDSAFPVLSTGTNTVTKSSSNFDLNVVFRNRYE